LWRTEKSICSKVIPEPRAAERFETTYNLLIFIGFEFIQTAIGATIRVIPFWPNIVQKNDVSLYKRNSFPALVVVLRGFDLL